MADLAADECWEIAESGKAFTLEHPGNSIARSLKSWKKLTRRRDVHVIEYHTCRFKGSQRRKFQVLITNRKEFIRWIGLKCEGNLCQRTGEPHRRWRPTVSCGKVVQFQTGDEREYPVGFCDAYSSAVKEILRRVAGEDNCFVEVFSGPNAPLSHAVGRATGVPVPGGRLSVSGKGEKTELQHLQQLSRELGASPSDTPKGDATRTQLSRSTEPYNRLVAIQAAKQPGYGKRIQLIPDGMKNPCLHLEKALELDHPFDHDTVLKPDHVVSLSAEYEPPRGGRGQAATHDTGAVEITRSRP